MPLLLRHPEKTDADQLFQAVHESIDELHRWMSWCSRDYSLADASSWIAGGAAARASRSAFEFVIVGDDGRIVGVCGLNQVRPENRLANLGYWIRSTACRRGYASEAVRQLAEWAWANTDLERLEIVVAVGNDASQSVARKAGAIREGVLRSRLLVHDRFHDAVMNSLIRPRPAAE